MTTVYKDAAARQGVDLRHYDRRLPNIKCRLADVDCIILFTNGISHEVATTTKKAAKSNAIPLIRCHSKGVSSLRKCIACACAKPDAADR